MLKHWCQDWLAKCYWSYGFWTLATQAWRDIYGPNKCELFAIMKTRKINFLSKIEQKNLYKKRKYKISIKWPIYYEFWPKFYYEFWLKFSYHFLNICFFIFSGSIFGRFSLLDLPRPCPSECFLHSVLSSQFWKLRTHWSPVHCCAQTPFSHCATPLWIIG